jgi:hypothetical protein
METSRAQENNKTRTSTKRAPNPRAKKELPHQQQQPKVQNLRLLKPGMRPDVKCWKRRND